MEFLAKGLEIKHQVEENTWKNEAKRRKVSMRNAPAPGLRGKGKFKCDICDANFQQKGTLNTHVKTIHEGKKKFKCDICSSKFGQKGNLNKHVAIAHEGKKQFKCDICDTSFGYKCNLQRHFATVHEGKKSVICKLSIANVTFKFFAMLNLHQNII